MRLTSLVSVGLLGGLLGGVATAQPTEPGPGGTTDVSPQPLSPPQLPPQPPPPPPRADPTTVPVMPEEREPEMRDIRPRELAFAIGLGYARAPGGTVDLQMPNIASVRLRLPSGITFEPTAIIGNSSTETNTGVTDTTETVTRLDLATLIRFPVIRHGRVDFEILGSIGLDVVKDDPSGDNNTKTTTSVGIGWGIGIGYWLSPHFQLSMSATNSILDITSTKQDTSATTSTKDSVTNFSLQFSPTMTVMLHLYN